MLITFVSDAWTACESRSVMAVRSFSSIVSSSFWRPLQFAVGFEVAHDEVVRCCQGPVGKEHMTVMLPFDAD